MICSFHIRGFKGYADTEIPLSQYCCIIGANGSGKTHILEGIHLVSGGGLQYIQAPRDDDIGLEVRYRSPIGDKTYSRERYEKKEKYRIQGSVLSGKKYIENLPYRTVFVSPFDMNIFYFSPSVRRDLLDDILERSFGQFRDIKREYENIVRQRNALLKKIREGEATKKDLGYWNRIFSEKAHIYHLYRKKWRTFLESRKEVFETLLPKYDIKHEYTSRIDEKMLLSGETSIEKCILDSLEETIERDISSGHTHIGPHLDDFTFLIKPKGESGEYKECGIFLSRGENKVLLLALKQMEILFLREYLDLPIVLLFDDIFAELDFLYAENIVRSLDANQVIMTSQRPLPEGEKWTHFSCINLNPVYHAENEHKYASNSSPDVL